MDTDRIIWLVTLGVVASILSLGIVVHLAGRASARVAAARTITLTRGSAMTGLRECILVGYPADEAGKVIDKVVADEWWAGPPAKKNLGLPSGRDGDRG